MIKSGIAGLVFGSVVVCLLEISVAAPAPERYFGFDQSAMRVFRRGGPTAKTTSQSNAKQMECPYDVITQPGEYYVDSAHAQICTWLFITGPNSIVEIELAEVELPCVEDTLIEFFDGVALQMGLFPTEYDHELPAQERINLVCKSGSRVLAASQNVAMLTFQAPSIGGSLRLSFKHKAIQSPCNVFNAQTSGAYTLSNFGQERNCSFAGIFPGYVSVLHMAVGRETNEVKLKCKDANDMVSFLEGRVLDFTKMNVEQRMCGRTGKSPLARDLPGAVVAPSDGYHGRDGTATSSLPLKNRAQCTSGINIPLMCQLSVVRLVSSGLYDNSITFLFTRESSEKDDCSM